MGEERAITMLDVLRQGLRSSGIMVSRIWTDEIHPQVLEPVEYRTQPGALDLKEYKKPFYRRLVRWRMDSGENGAVLLDPILRKRGSRWDEDGHAMLQQLGQLMRDHYSPALSTGAKG